MDCGDGNGPLGVGIDGGSEDLMGLVYRFKSERPKGPSKHDPSGLDLTSHEETNQDFQWLVKMWGWRMQIPCTLAGPIPAQPYFVGGGGKHTAWSSCLLSIIKVIQARGLRSCVRISLDCFSYLL